MDGPRVVYDWCGMPPAHEPRAGASLAPLLFLFLLSGASALVYQVLWMRLLALVFGVTVHAASTVLAAFMTGLAIGSAAAGRLSDRVARPLVVFAVAEALVAVAALATPLGLTAVEALYVRLYPTLSGWPLLVAFVRFLLSFAVLVVPATLMGATLPLVVKSALARGAILGRQVSLLYAFNTAGAVAGTLVAGIWMVPQLGISWAFRIGAMINLIVAAGALLLAKLSASRAAASVHAPPPAAPAVADANPAYRAASSRAVQRLVLLTFAVSGFVSFGLEIIWFRMLVILFRPTTYAFTLMLATVLAGIAAGSALSTPLTSRRRIEPVAALATLELLLALAAVLSMAMIGSANGVYMWAGPVFAGTSLAYFGPMIVTSIVAIFPAALLMGMAFPLGIAIWTSQVANERAGARIGSIYAVNVAGAVAGSLLTGFLLLPAIGGRASLLLASAMALGMGLLLLATLSSRARAAVAGVAAVIAFAGIATATPDPVTRLLRSRYPRETMVWREEDGHATVTILRRDSAFAATTHGLYINGMHQASDTPTMVNYHRLIGTLPVAVHPEPRRALVIGAGGGATAGAVAAFSADTAVDVVELSPAVVDAARQFSGINQGLFTRPNVRLRVDDGRNYMLLTPEKVRSRDGGRDPAGARGRRKPVFGRVLPADAPRPQQPGHRAAVDRQHRRDRIQADHADVLHGVPAHHVVAWRQPDGRIHAAAGAGRSVVPAKAGVSAVEGRARFDGIQELRRPVVALYGRPRRDQDVSRRRAPADGRPAAHRVLSLAPAERRGRGSVEGPRQRAASRHSRASRGRRQRRRRRCYGFTVG